MVVSYDDSGLHMDVCDTAFPVGKSTKLRASGAQEHTHVKMSPVPQWISISISLAPFGSNDLLCVDTCVFPRTPVESLFCGDASPLSERLDAALQCLDGRDLTKVDERPLSLQGLRTARLQQTEAAFKNLVLGVLFADPALRTGHYTVRSEVCVPQPNGSPSFPDLILTHCVPGRGSSVVVVIELKYTATYYCRTDEHAPFVVRPHKPQQQLVQHNNEFKQRATALGPDYVFVKPFEIPDADQAAPVQNVSAWTRHTLFNQAWTRYGREHLREDGHAHDGRLWFGLTGTDPRAPDKQGNWAFALCGNAVVCSWSALRYRPAGRTAAGRRSAFPYQQEDQGSLPLIWLSGHGYSTPATLKAAPPSAAASVAHSAQQEPIPSMGAAVRATQTQRPSSSNAQQKKNKKCKGSSLCQTIDCQH
jgi:hypothetical protein